MVLVITTIIFLCTFFIWCLSLQCCVAGDNLTTGTSIGDENHETLVSPGENFELGFFSPKGTDRYVGIWYKEDPQTVVWVANRDKPLPGSTGVVLVAEDGNFKVLDKEKGNSYFSTDLDFQSSSRILKLLDTGNLVLVDDETGSNIVWQSFQSPTDTFLPGMKMGDSIKLTSWKSKHDPASGDFTFQEDTEGQNQYIIFKETTTSYWKSGKLSASSFTPSRMFGAATIMLSNNSRQVAVSVRNSAKTNLMLTPSAMLNYSDSRLLMNSSGEIQYWNWHNVENGKQWILLWSEPKDNCSIYNTCGIYAMCRSRNGCECLPGFEPNNVDNWNSGDYTTGCKRMYDMCRSDLNYTFSNLTMMEVGESNSQFFSNLGSEECKNKCLAKCECQAYSYKPNNTDSIIAGRPGRKEGCWIWQSDSELADIREGYADSGHNLTLKIADDIVAGLGNPQKSEGSPHKPPKHSPKPLVISAITILVILLLCSMSYIGYWRMMNARRESRESNRGNIEFQLPDSVRRIKDLLDGDQFREDATKSFDVPFFDLECILAATNDFSHANKLGQGGFGPVYKGNLPGGQEIAVKRLSSDSGQGLEEFKNEVLVIAKLQHRNLVRLLGYCVKADEKMLLYEYMPNKSLDNFIFDRTLCLLLDWPKRFEIILGITRGLLYLHQDSRLRIIHRDLKTSNILLDEEMNPKISDFGLARIVGGRETEASTNKVIGTYGYMSPEYALDGFFSIKSDVFSFGVVMLEIISGKRNTGFYESQQALNLLGYAWSLWNEEKALDLMDQTLVQLCNPSEVLKCINVGLLCVQEDPVDRPTMSNVVFMLGSDVASLQQPKQPAFVARRRISSSPSSSSGKHDSLTNNELTISVQEGR